MKLKGILVMLAVYVAAFAVAVYIALFTEIVSSFVLRCLLADVIATIIVWLCGLIFSNSSLYDPYWSVQPLFLAAMFIVKNGVGSAAVVAIVPIVVWSFRLTYNFFKGWDGLKSQDWRYSKFKQENSKFAWFFINLFGINMMPTLLVFFGTLPLYFLADKTATAFSYLGAAVMLGATVCQAVADKQLYNFKSSGGTGVIDTGLWRYSRHPNYFGEVTLWWGLFVCTISIAPVYAVGGAVAITLLFEFISIPLMEKRIAHKENFDVYKKTTSRLIPMPKRNGEIKNSQSQENG